jgi:DNA-binding transcriptional regulator YhcF (GntR family)
VNAAFDFRLDLKSGVPVYRQLIDQVLVAIASGQLESGDQLPTVRQLAVDLSINPNTVVRAYKELEIRGMLTTQQGTGTFITPKKVKIDDAQRQKRLSQMVGEFVARRKRRRVHGRRHHGAPGRARRRLLEEEIMSVVIPAVLKGGSTKSGLAVQPVSPLGALCGIGVFVVAAIVTAFTQNPVPIIVGVLAGLYLMLSLKVADQWQKVAVLRLGKYQGLRGPWLVPYHPVIDTMSNFVDQRVRVTDVTAESALTRDTVPVNVDAIVFWVVWNAEKCISKWRISLLQLP